MSVNRIIGMLLAYLAGIIITGYNPGAFVISCILMVSSGYMIMRTDEEEV